MAETDLAELERLCAAATKGDWTVRDEPERTYGDGEIDKGGYRIDASNVEQLAYVWRDAVRWGGGAEPFGAQEAEANAAFIAAAKREVPALIARVRQMEAALRLASPYVESVANRTDRSPKTMRATKDVTTIRAALPEKPTP